MWHQWVTALLGLAVVVVPFLGIMGNALAWTLAVFGIAIAAVSLWGAMEHERGFEEFSEKMT